MLNRFCITLLAITGFATSLSAQSQNMAAVDTLTKDVAIAVFANISQPKAQEIYAQLLSCSDGCDAQTIIRQVGSWDQVGAKLEELTLLKDTERFQKMSPVEANAAIRKQLTDFYNRHKAEKPYSVPLSPGVQAQILAKIDGLLPPAQDEPLPATTTLTDTTGQADTDVVDGGEGGVNPAALQRSQLERALNESKEKQLWTMLISGLVGLLVGAGAVYLLLYRSAKSEIGRLVDENGRLSDQLDTLRRTKPGNVQLPPANYKHKAEVYDTLVTELGSDPLTAARQLKKQASLPRGMEPTPVRPAEVVADPLPEPLPPLPPLPPLAQMQGITPTPVINEVVYFPPPDPNGLFDGNLQTATRSPESAYQFIINADKPDLARFRFEAEPGRVARFLTYRNYMIEPACDSENSYSSQHTRIVNQRDGEAVRETNGWRVTTKAVIRYE